MVINPYIFHREPNTFIGGVGFSSVTSISDFLMKTEGLEVINIRNFKIDEYGNVSLYIGKWYRFIQFAFQGDISLTFFVDLDGRLRSDTDDVFRSTSLRHIRSNSIENNRHRTFYESPLELAYFPKAVTFGGYQKFGNNFDHLRRGYFPRMEAGFNTHSTNAAFNPSTINGATIYAPEGWGDAPPGTISILNFFNSAIDKGGVVKEVLNFDVPMGISDLVVDEIAETSVRVNFTPPTSINAIDFYEIWLDDGTDDPEQKYFPQRQEITASGQIITGLKPNTTYRLKLATCDTYYNGSGMSDSPALSNEVSFTTALGSFITTWETTTPDESITIPTTSIGYNYRVDWGDGTITQGHTGNSTHIYTVAGIYTVKISGDFPRIYFNNGGDRLKIKSIEQWGNIVWGSFGAAFYGCQNLVGNYTDRPNLDNVSALNLAFMFCHSFNGNVSDWDVSNVVIVNNMFRNCTSFNRNVSAWNTLNIRDMGGAFYGCTIFDQDLSNWNFESVTNINNFLNGATLSTANYDALLISMASQDLNPDLTFHGGNSKYSPAAVAARNILINDYGWSITDGGPV